VTFNDQLAANQLDSIRDCSAAITALTRGIDLAQPVDHLGRWKVRDVVAHLGGVHRWADRIVQKRSMQGPGFTKSKLDGNALCDWFAEGAASLLATLESSDPESACPNFNPGSQADVAWWIRRQAHETAVHRWDIERSLGTPTKMTPALAADGVDEFLDVFVRTRGKQTLTSPLVLHTNRPKRAWTLTPAEKPGRIDIATGVRVEAGLATEVTGSPEALLLALWGRPKGRATLQIQGDQSAAESLLRLT
jgi:uncharacterized protein (TIGR03083 family)